MLTICLSVSLSLPLGAGAGLRSLIVVLPGDIFFFFSTACKYEPGHEKTCLRDFRPGKTQTGLLSYTNERES